jgi:hypothetical protein
VCRICGKEYSCRACGPMMDFTPLSRLHRVGEVGGELALDGQKIMKKHNNQLVIKGGMLERCMCGVKRGGGLDPIACGGI